MGLIETNNTEANRYELTVQVPADIFEQALARAYRKNVKKINVQGFRKGKAPRAVVERMYGEGVFFEDAVQEVYPMAVQQAIEESGLEVVVTPDIEITKVDKQSGVTILAKCITKPEVSVKDYLGIAVEKQTKQVTEQDIDEKLQLMREKHARMIDASDRAAQDGDTVVFDFDGYVDDQPFEGGKAEDFRLVLGSGQFIPGFEQQIEGHRVEEDFSVTVTFPEDYHAEALKGKPAVFKCNMKEIQAKELPDIDDEFAKDASEFDTLSALKEDIKNKQQQENEKAATAEMENGLIDAVIQNMTAEIPDEMYQKRMDEMVRDFEARLQPQGIDLKTYLQYTGMDAESFRHTFKEQAQRQVKVRLALEKIAQLEDIQVDDDAVEQEYQKMADTYHMELEQVKGFVAMADLKKDLAVNQAVQMIKDNAQVTEK